MSHTQGKLRVAKDVQDWSVSNDECCSTCYTDLTSESGTVIALVVSGEKSVHANPDPRPDARRLVAAWNACDGISTEVLEGIPGVMKATVPYHELKAQRDELLAALEETWRVINSAGLLNLSNGVQLGATSWYVKASTAREISAAAIANTKGQS